MLTTQLYHYKIIMIEPMNISPPILKPDNIVRLCGDYKLTTSNSTAKIAKSGSTTEVRRTFMGMEAMFKVDTSELNVLPKFLHSPIHKWKWSVEQEDAFELSKLIFSVSRSSKESRLYETSHGYGLWEVLSHKTAVQDPWV